MSPERKDRDGSHKIYRNIQELIGHVKKFGPYLKELVGHVKKYGLYFTTRIHSRVVLRGSEV